MPPFGYPIDASDHKTIFLNTSVPDTMSNSQNDSLQRQWSSVNWQLIGTAASTIDWEELFRTCSSTDSLWDTFVGVCNQLIEDFVPISGKCHVTSDIYKKFERFKYIEHRRKCAYTNNPTAHNFLMWRNTTAKIRKLRCEMTEEREYKFLHTLIKTKQFWSFYKSKMKPRSTIPVISSKSGTDLLTTETKSEGLNLFFNSVYRNHDHPFPVINPSEPQENLVMMNHVFDDFSVYQAIKLLPNKLSCGIDNIPNLFLKKLVFLLVQPLGRIFRHSFASSTCPAGWKKAIVVPVPKKTLTHSVQGYRPISLTPTSSKLMERIVRAFMVKFLTDRRLLNPAQYGFLPGRSTELQLLYCLNDWTLNFEKRVETHIFYLDICKAFDSVSHPLLINKLLTMGFPTSIVAWIRSFLENRSHCVKINRYHSSYRDAPSGVPQGAVLSPLLFAIFVNDLPSVVQHSKVVMYADDVKIYKSINSDADSKEFQADINSVFDWLSNNGMSASPTKCCLLRLGNKINFPQNYTLNNDLIPEVTSNRDLGIIIDPHLNFVDHIQKIANQAASKTGNIRHSFQSQSVAFRKKAFVSCIRPSLEYASTVWSPQYLKYIVQVERGQRRYSSLIPAFIDQSYSERLQNLNLDTLLFRRFARDLFLVFKLVKGLFSGIPVDTFFTRSNSAYDIRHHRYHFKKPKAETNVRRHFWSVRIINLWNNIPDSTFDLPVSQFKLYLYNTYKPKIIEYIKSQYYSIDYI
jgi:hypothetical protein